MAESWKRERTDDLDRRDAEIIKLREQLGWTLEAIGDHYNISRERVRQIVRDRKHER
jgi:DNA-directed RNA polymerase sigma subunit (sigma70/sigma32)